MRSIRKLLMANLCKWGRCCVRPLPLIWCASEYCILYSTPHVHICMLQ